MPDERQGNPEKQPLPGSVSDQNGEEQPGQDGEQETRRKPGSAGGDESTRDEGEAREGSQATGDPNAAG
jgi:hypothetical protein